MDVMQDELTTAQAAPEVEQALDATEDAVAGISQSTPLLLRAEDAAALCNVSLRTWRSWDTGGKIPSPVRIGRSTFWRPGELHDWVDAGCPERHLWQWRR